MNSYKISSPPFAGMSTFAKFPVLTTETLHKGKNGYGIIGVPYDMGVTNIPGARFGPREIRNASTQYAYTSSSDYLGLSSSLRGFYDINKNKWLLKNKPCYDLGDIEVTAGNPKATFISITENIGRLLSLNICPIILGGDHSITYPVIKAFKNFKDITILHFDAHMDYWDPAKNCIYDHSCPMWSVSKLSNIKHIYQFGIRGLNHNPSMMEEAKNNKITTITSQQIRDDFSIILNKVVLSKNIYISFDIDFFDPSIAPGTGNREQDGFNYTETSKLMNNLLKNNDVSLIGLDLVEINPLNDVSHLTCSLGARILIDLLGFFN